MGLGKTIQALAVASAYQKDWPLLIVCPSSVRFSWRSAIFRWLPSVPEEDVIVITSGKIHLPISKSGHKIVPGSILRLCLGE